MAIAKLIKNKAYFKRYQTKYRRRREGKTDYKQRRRLTTQRLDRYGQKKFRLVVRLTSKFVICQIVYATIAGDVVFCQAHSRELPRYGIKAGLKNYSAAYATGLLVGRRVLQKVGLDEAFTGVEEADGEKFDVEKEDDEDAKNPFCAILDVGLRRTTRGSRVFGALKGAADAGISIPHAMKNFPGYSEPLTKGEEAPYDAEVHRDRIMGIHVGSYMETMKDEDEVKFKSQFSQYIKNGMDCEDMQEIYAEAHRQIRANPEFVPAPKKDITHTRTMTHVTTSTGVTYRACKPLTTEERRARVAAKMERGLQAAAANMDVESESE